MGEAYYNRQTDPQNAEGAISNVEYTMLSIIERLLTVWATFAHKASWLVVGLFLLAAAFAGHFTVNNLSVSTDTGAMIDGELDFQVRAAELKAAFPQLKNGIILLAKAPTLDEADAYAAKIAELIEKDTEHFTDVFAPSTDPFFTENGLLFLSESELEARLTQLTKAAGLIETLVKSPTADTLFKTLAENDELADRSELGKDTLIDIYEELALVIEASLEDKSRPFSWMGALDTDAEDEDSFLRIVYARPIQDFSRLQPAKEALQSLRDNTTLLSADFNGRVEAYVTGGPALRGEEMETVTQGIGLSFLISFLMVAALLLFAFRSVVMATITLVGLVITIILTSAFAAAAFGELNLVSVAFTVLLVGLGLDFAIHLLLHIQERRADGQSTNRALKGAIHEVGPALTLAAPTTALAFLSFVPTSFDGIAQLGVIAGVGVLIAFFISVTFLPAALSAFPIAKARKTSGVISRGFNFIESISTPVTIVTVILGVGALFLLPQARFDADPMALRNPDSPSVQAFNLLFEDPSTTPYRLTRLVNNEQEAIDTATRAKAIETVDSARSLVDFIPEDQDEKLELIDFAAGTLVFALNPEAETNSNNTPGDGVTMLRDRLKNAYSDGPPLQLAELLDRALSTNDPQVLIKIENNIFMFWPRLIEQLRSQFEADYVDFDRLPQPLKDRYISANGKWRVDINPAEDIRDRKILKRFFDSVEAVFPDIGGAAIQNLKAGETISRSMLQATLIALAVISFILLIVIRRPSLVVLILAPLVLAAILTTAAGVVFNVPFNFANVIVLPLLIGIGVDSGIHLVMRQQQVKAGEGLYGTSTPRAVLFSALTTVASFGALMLSPHRGTASMGQLLSIAIAFTLICTLIVLPAAFRYGEKRAKQKAATSA